MADSVQPPSFTIIHDVHSRVRLSSGWAGPGHSMNTGLPCWVATVPNVRTDKLFGLTHSQSCTVVQSSSFPLHPSSPFRRQALPGVPFIVLPSLLIKTHPMATSPKSMPIEISCFLSLITLCLGLRPHISPCLIVNFSVHMCIHSSQSQYLLLKEIAMLGAPAGCRGLVGKEKGKETWPIYYVIMTSFTRQRESDREKTPVLP